MLESVGRETETAGAGTAVQLQPRHLATRHLGVQHRPHFLEEVSLKHLRALADRLESFWDCGRESLGPCALKTLL